MSTRESYRALNRKGEVCHPHRYDDGRFRAVRYEAGNPKWKAANKGFSFTDEEMTTVMADPELYVRMSPANNPRSPALFRAANITNLRVKT